MMVNNQYTYTVLFFTFSTVFNTLHETVNILLQRGSVLDSFAQLEAHVSVLNTFKVGEVRHLCSVDQVYFKAFLKFFIDFIFGLATSSLLLAGFL